PLPVLRLITGLPLFPMLPETLTCISSFWPAGTLSLSFGFTVSGIGLVMLQDMSRRDEIPARVNQESGALNIGSYYAGSSVVRVWPIPYIDPRQCQLECFHRLPS